MLRLHTENDNFLLFSGVHISIAIVLLMQTVWWCLLEMILKKITFLKKNHIGNHRIIYVSACPKFDSKQWGRISAESFGTISCNFTATIYSQSSSGMF
jgi:hypothetical protein